MKACTFIGILLFISLTLQGQTYKKTPQGVILTTQNMKVEIKFYTNSIVRISKIPIGDPDIKQSQIIQKEAESTHVDYEIGSNNLRIKSLLLSVKVNIFTGGIVFCTNTGEQLIKDKDYGTTFSSINGSEIPSYHIRSSFLLDKNEPIYGIGQVMDGKLNRRNSTYHLQNENMSTYSPYFISPTKGYAIYWDNYSISDFTDTPQGLALTSLGSYLDYYFIYGETADGIIAKVRSLTGKAPMLPLWTYGFLQSKERYHTQKESLEVLQKYRKLKIPIDCIIQDWRYWPQYNKTDSAWNSQRFDSIRFPNPPKWANEIHKLHAKLMIVTWPGFGPKTEQYKELKAQNMMLNFETWPPQGGARPYDVYNPKALDIYWKYLKTRIFDYIHNDGWWLDSTEPDHINRREKDYEAHTYLGSYRNVKNIYSLKHNSGIFNHQKAETLNKRVVILTRSGFIGQQRYGSNTWSGDVSSTWDMLQKQIPAALNYTLMGIPNWNSDIGGFFAGQWNSGGGAKNPNYQELYVRWMQFGTFCPMMRSHGTDIPREIWNFGEPGEWCFDAQKKMIKFRYRMLPYIYSTSWDVSHNNGTFMRALIMDFSKDKRVYDLGSEYMFGRSLLVIPITKPKVHTWPVYLPQGNKWWDFWTNTLMEGGQEIERATSKETIPLYVKAGSILPFGPDVQYSTEKKWNNLEIRIYPGENGSFTLYEDENDNYNYEKGIYSTINFSWNETDQSLTIEKRKGEFPGILKTRLFNIIKVNAKSEEADKPMSGGKKVRYKGKKIKISF